MSSLQALSGFKLEIHFVQNIIKDYTHLINSGKTSCFVNYHLILLSSIYSIHSLPLHGTE